MSFRKVGITMSKTRTSTPLFRSLSTTCEPIKPDPPVTSTLIALISLCIDSDCRIVIEGHAPVVLRNPFGIGEATASFHDGMAQLVIHLSRGLLDRLEHDVFVVPGDHSVWKMHPLGKLGVQMFPGDLVFPCRDLLHPINL